MFCSFSTINNLFVSTLSSLSRFISGIVYYLLLCVYVVGGGLRRARACTRSTVRIVSNSFLWFRFICEDGVEIFLQLMCYPFIFTRDRGRPGRVVRRLTGWRPVLPAVQWLPFCYSLISLLLCRCVCSCTSLLCVLVVVTLSACGSCVLSAVFSESCWHCFLECISRLGCSPSSLLPFRV